MANSFDPNAAATPGSGIFGLPYQESEAALVYLPVPWEATTSYGNGTSKGPQAILKASHQVDLFDLEVERPYQPGLFLLKESKEVIAWNKEAKKKASQIIKRGGVTDGHTKLQAALKRVNELGDKLNQYVSKETQRLLKTGKIVGLIGGDHSTPFGAIRAVAEKHRDLGILQFDAHMDLRRAYEGFAWSHASIMFNVLTRIPQVKKLVQVGIRDFCEEEMDFYRSQGSRMQVFFDTHLAKRKFKGDGWDKIANEIVSALPQNIWISFDIDGLDPKFCPRTGTPVPGGLEFQEANYLLSTVAQSGRKIIGFDLNEVSPHPKKENEWDANVGARLLYKLSAWTLVSQGKAEVYS